MAEHFQLQITYQGKEKVYEAQLLQLGYLHKIQAVSNFMTGIRFKIKT
jgi:hypothetical protein